MTEDAQKKEVDASSFENGPVFHQTTNPSFHETKELAKLVAQSDERRHFNRANISDKKLEIHFADGAQFARQYIENISVGGLFVRSDRKAKMGDTLAIEFSIPRQDRPHENLSFLFMSRVCRVTAEGLGVEFLNISHENRRNLEEYVRAVLPTQVPVANKPKASTVAHIEEMRQRKRESEAARRSFAIRFLFFAVMICLNLWMISRKDSLESENSLKTKDIRRSIQVGHKSVEANDIQSITLKDQKTVVLKLSDGSHVETTVENFDRKAPPHILQSMAALQSIEIPKVKRKSKNTGRLTRLR